MSLLWMDYEAEFDNLVDTANQYETYKKDRLQRYPV